MRQCTWVSIWRLQYTENSQSETRYVELVFEHLGHPIKGTASLEPFDLSSIHGVLKHHLILATVTMLQDALYWLCVKGGKETHTQRDGDMRERENK